jgi:hypothetical protein
VLGDRGEAWTSGAVEMARNLRVCIPPCARVLPFYTVSMRFFPGFAGHHHLITNCCWPVPYCTTTKWTKGSLLSSPYREIIVQLPSGKQKRKRTDQHTSQDASEPNHLSHSSATAHTAPDCANEALLGKQRITSPSSDPPHKIARKTGQSAWATRRRPWFPCERTARGTRLNSVVEIQPCQRMLAGSREMEETVRTLAPRELACCDSMRTFLAARQIPTARALATERQTEPNAPPWSTPDSRFCSQDRSARRSKSRQTGHLSCLSAHGESDLRLRATSLKTACISVEVDPTLGFQFRLPCLSPKRAPPPAALRYAMYLGTRTN